MPLRLMIFFFFSLLTKKPRFHLDPPRRRYRLTHSLRTIIQDDTGGREAFSELVREAFSELVEFSTGNEGALGRS